MDFNHDGTILATGSDDKTIKIYRVEGSCLELIETFNSHTKYEECLAFNNNGTMLATGSGGSTVKIFQFDAKSKFISIMESKKLFSQMLSSQF